MFFPPIQAFMVLPFNQLQTVPLSDQLPASSPTSTATTFSTCARTRAGRWDPLLRWTHGAATPG